MSIDLQGVLGYGVMVDQERVENQEFLCSIIEGKVELADALVVGEFDVLEIIVPKGGGRVSFGFAEEIEPVEEPSPEELEGMASALSRIYGEDVEPSDLDLKLYLGSCVT